jgi:hypothetical protein
LAKPRRSGAGEFDEAEEIVGRLRVEAPKLGDSRGMVQRELDFGMEGLRQLGALASGRISQAALVAALAGVGRNLRPQKRFVVVEVKDIQRKNLDNNLASIR